MTLFKEDRRFIKRTNAGTEEAFRLYLDSLTEDEVIDLYYRDFNGDQEYECFAVTSREAVGEGDPQAVTIWYMNKEGYEILGEYDIQETKLLELNNSIYFAADLYYVTGSASCIWSVVEGKPLYLDNISNKAYISQREGQLLANASSYDIFFDKESGLTVGHSWKDYWLYNDETGIHEYGATEISEKEFRHYSGSKEIIELIKEKVGEEWVISWSQQFLRRQNGIINVNISLEDEKSIQYINLTVRLKGNQVSVAEDVGDGCWNDGTYKEAWNEEIATYE